VLPDSASTFSGAPESTCSYRGVFRMLQYLTDMIVKFLSTWDLWAGLWETRRWDEISAQLYGRLGAVFSHLLFLCFHNHQTFHLSYSSLFQSQDLLHTNMAIIICLSLTTNITYSQSCCGSSSGGMRKAPGDAAYENAEMHFYSILVGKSRSHHHHHSVWHGECSESSRGVQG